MNAFVTQFLLTAPLYLLVGLGFAVAKVARVPERWQRAFARLIFAVLLPVLLFHLMSDPSGFSRLRWEVLAAFFGGCLVVFLVGREVARRGLGLTPREGAVFGIGGVFSNNVMLGLPLAQLTLGTAAIPTVAMVLVFNALVLWTLVTVAVEASQRQGAGFRGLLKTLRGVLLNPIVVGIALGLIWGLTGLEFPSIVEGGLELVGQAAGPLALVSLGMSLAGYPGQGDAKLTASLATFKLVAHPLAVWGLAVVIGLPLLETQVVVLLASTAIGSNVYLMSQQFGVLQRPVSRAILFSTMASTLTTPLILGLVSGLG